MKKRITIRPFDGNYQRLSDMIRRAWPLEHQGFIDFTPRYLQYLIERPDTDNRLTLGAYREDKLVSFLLSKRKMVATAGKKEKALLNTLSTTDPEAAFDFPYLPLRELCLEEAIQNGYVLSYGFMDHNIKNLSIERLLAEKRGLHYRIVRSFGNYVFALGTGKKIERPKSIFSLSALGPEESAAWLARVSRQTRSLSIREVWDKSSLLYQHGHKGFDFFYAFKKQEAVQGFVQYQRVGYRNGSRIQEVAFIKQLCFRGGHDRQRLSFLRLLIRHLWETGLYAVSIPDTGAWDASFIESAGFIRMSFKNMQRSLFMVRLDKGKIDSARNGAFHLEIV